MKQSLWKEAYTVTRLLSEYLMRRAKTTADMNCIASQFAYRAAVLYSEARDKRAAAMHFYAMADRLVTEMVEEKRDQASR